MANLTPAQRKAAEALAIGFGGNMWVSIDGSSSGIRNVGADVTEWRPYWGFVRRQIESNGDVTLSVSDSERGEPIVSIKVANAVATEQAYKMSEDIVVLSCNREALFDHHVDGLAGQLVSLLRFTVDHYPESVEENEEQSEKAWAKTQQRLADLYDEALPDPLDEDEWDELPKTYWKFVHTDTGSFPVVVHKGKNLSVDSKKTAVHAVLLLRNSPDMPLADAVKAANAANGYRPE